MAKKQSIEKHFSDTASVWKNKIYRSKSEQKLFEYFDKQYRFDYVVNMVPANDGSKEIRALDMGCGAGQLIPILSGLGYEPYGVDISDKMIGLTNEQCKKLNIKANLMIGDCEKLDFPDEFFDLYIAMGVIEYMSSDKPMLSEIYRVLKPGGTAIVTLRNINCIPIRINYYYKSKIQNSIRNAVKKVVGLPMSTFEEISKEHDPDEFKKILQNYSFRVLDEKYCHYHALPLPFSRWLLPIQTISGKIMEEKFKDAPKPLLASTYIIKFKKPF